MRERQAGASVIGWLIILALIGFIALVVIRLLPVYMESYTVKTVVDALDDGDLRGKSRVEVLQSVLKRLDVNNIDAIKRENIKLEDVSGGLELSIDYERRFPIAGNLDGIVRFRDQTLIRN